MNSASTSAKPSPEPSQGRRGAVGVVVEEGKFLVIRRSPLVRAPNLLCFPGGGVETGETSDVAVVRELREELHLETRVERLLWKSVTAWGTQLDWFLVHRTPDQVPKANPQEVAEVLWMVPGELLPRRDTLGSVPEFFRAWLDGLFDLPHDTRADWYHLL